MENILIRKGRKNDISRAFELVCELAEFERARHEVVNSIGQMEQDGFGPHPIFGFFVAEVNSEVVGISLYYYRYSTWKGRRLYLEDIVVSEAHRGRGIGQKLFRQTMQQTLEDGCSGMMWQVLDWNEPAIEFYKKYGAKFSPEWTNASLEAGQIRTLIIA